MFATARHILDRLVEPRSRANELKDVRCRLAAQPGPGFASATEAQLAQRLRALREELSARLGKVEACGQCARPRSASWPGGYCCSAQTRNLFTDDELAALKLSGTTSTQLKPPRSDPAGCAFRGPQGCSLDAAHRPSLCVRYVCRELQGELEHRRDWSAIAQLQEELRAVFERFTEIRAERIEATHFAELTASLGARAGHG